MRIPKTFSTVAPAKTTLTISLTSWPKKLSRMTSLNIGTASFTAPLSFVPSFTSGCSFIWTFSSPRICATSLRAFTTQSFVNFEYLNVCVSQLKDYFGFAVLHGHLEVILSNNSTFNIINMGDVFDSDPHHTRIEAQVVFTAVEFAGRV